MFYYKTKDSLYIESSRELKSKQLTRISKREYEEATAAKADEALEV